MIQYFVPPVPLRKENYEAKEGGKKSIHFNGSHENIELLLRTVISSISSVSTVADLFNELPKYLRAPSIPAAPDHLEKMEIPTNPSIAEHSTNAQERGDERKFEQMSEDQK